MTPLFDLTSEGWIQCLDEKGKPTKPLGLLELFAEAHHLSELRGDSPLVEAALYRLLLAILHANFQNTKQRQWANLWRDKKFDIQTMQTLKDYFAKWQDQKQRFFVYHDTHPFYQSPTALVTIKDGKEQLKPIAELVHDIASGNNATLFDHHIHYEDVEAGNFALPIPAAIRMVIAAQAYKLAGTSGHKGSFKRAPLVDGITFLAKGDTLFETLMLNLLEVANGDPFPQEADDKPCWERDDPFLPHRASPRGYMDYLTWQHCRILLDKPQTTEQGLMVSKTRMSIGLVIADDNRKRDPMKAFYAKDDARLRPIGWDAERALWRDSTALFHVRRLRQNRSLQANKDKLPPRVFEFFADLIAENAIDQAEQQRLSKYRCIAFGLRLGENPADVEFYRREEMPLPPSYFTNADLLTSLDQALEDARKIEGKLGDAANEVVKYLMEVKPKQESSDIEKRKQELRERMKARYWPRLEQPFLRLMATLQSTTDTPAMLVEWQKTVFAIAQQAFDEVVDGLGTTARAHKARVRGQMIMNGYKKS